MPQVLEAFEQNLMRRVAKHLVDAKSAFGSALLWFAREDFEMYGDRYIGFLLWTGFAMFGTFFSCCSLSKVQDKRGLNGGVEACMQTFLSSLDRTVQRCYSINYITMQGTPTGQNRTKTYKHIIPRTKKTSILLGVNICQKRSSKTSVDIFYPVFGE